MKIIRVYAKQVWGIDECDISPGGKSVAITGRNRAGKTSVLKAIQSGVFGPIDGTIRHGAEEGRILIELEELSIDRVIDADNKTKKLTVTSHDIRVTKSPQAFLNKIAGALAFNPVQFYLEAPRKQREMLLAAIPMSISPDSLVQMAIRLGGPPEPVMINIIENVDTRWDRHALEVSADLFKAAYETRAAVGRAIADKEEMARGLASVDAPAVDLARLEYLGKEVKIIEADKESARKAELEVVALQDRIDQTNLKVTAMERELASLKEWLADRAVALEASRTAASALADKVPADHDRRAMVDELESLREAKRRYDLAEVTRSRAEGFQSEVNRLTIRRQDLDKACQFFRELLPAALIADSKLPVDGLSVDDNGVLIDERPLETLSEAEKMMVAMRIAEAQASGDGMKFILLDGVERLDEDTFAVLESRAKVGDIQFFFTKVTSGELQVQAV